MFEDIYVSSWRSDIYVPDNPSTPGGINGMWRIDSGTMNINTQERRLHLTNLKAHGLINDKLTF